MFLLLGIPLKLISPTAQVNRIFSPGGLLCVPMRVAGAGSGRFRILEGSTLVRKIPVQGEVQVAGRFRRVPKVLKGSGAGPAAGCKPKFRKVLAQVQLTSAGSGRFQKVPVLAGGSGTSSWAGSGPGSGRFRSWWPASDGSDLGRWFYVPAFKIYGKPMNFTSRSHTFCTCLEEIRYPYLIAVFISSLI